MRNKHLEAIIQLITDFHNTVKVVFNTFLQGTVVIGYVGITVCTTCLDNTGAEFLLEGFNSVALLALAGDFNGSIFSALGRCVYVSPAVAVCITDSNVKSNIIANFKPRNKAQNGEYQAKSICYNCDFVELPDTIIGY